MLFPPFGRGRPRFSVMRVGTVLRLCGVFIPDVFLLWFQNGEVRGPRVSVGGAYLSVHRTGIE
ncbi:hypothetical protein A4T38_24720 [Escherichia coli]|nr:hypothetical protein A4T38_24720 [Escherichia coli]